MENIFSLINLSAIWNLPTPYNWAAFAILGFLILSTIFSVLKLRLIKAALKLFYVIIFAVLMSAFAPLMGAFDKNEKPVSEQTSTDN